jgi:hypothetical protein
MLQQRIQAAVEIRSLVHWTDSVYKASLDVHLMVANNRKRVSVASILFSSSEQARRSFKLLKVDSCMPDDPNCRVTGASVMCCIYGVTFIGLMTPGVTSINMGRQAAVEVFDAIHRTPPIDPASKDGNLVFAVAAFVGNIMIGIGLSRSGARLSGKMRRIGFSAILRRSIGWFDDADNTTGELTTILGADAEAVAVLTGIEMGYRVRVLSAERITSEE